MSGEADALDAFKAAALSVTKLYKTAAAAQAKAREDGYHDCLDDLLAFLDKEGLGTSTTDGEASRIRRWALERMDGREVLSPNPESDEEADKTEVVVAATHRSSSAPIPSAPRDEMQMTDASPPLAPQPVHTVMVDADIHVPTQDTFNFQSSVPYPHDAHMNLANLDLSDSRNHTTTPTSRTTTSATTPRSGRGRVSRAGRGTPISQVAGQKRKMNPDWAKFFDIGNGKDVFGGGNKRSRLS